MPVRAVPDSCRGTMACAPDAPCPYDVMLLFGVQIFKKLFSISLLFFKRFIVYIFPIKYPIQRIILDILPDVI